jgi:hypothetical protein
MALQPDSALMIFSSGQMAEATSDNFLLPADYWPLGPSTNLTAVACES